MNNTYDAPHWATTALASGLIVSHPGEWPLANRFATELQPLHHTETQHMDPDTAFANLLNLFSSRDTPSQEDVLEAVTVLADWHENRGYLPRWPADVPSTVTLLGVTPQRRGECIEQLTRMQVGIEEENRGVYLTGLRNLRPWAMRTLPREATGVDVEVDPMVGTAASWLRWLAEDKAPPPPGDTYVTMRVCNGGASVQVAVVSIDARIAQSTDAYLRMALEEAGLPLNDVNPPGVPVPAGGDWCYMGCTVHGTPSYIEQLVLREVASNGVVANEILVGYGTWPTGDWATTSRSAT